jgi:putative transposase
VINTYPNVLRQNFKEKRPNQKWGTDITYIRTEEGLVYLINMKDFYDGLIVGYAMSQHFSIRMVLQALLSAASSSRSIKGVILQSDQGFQYQSAAFHSLVSQNEINISMSRKGNCLDNAPTENFFSH